MDLSRIKKIVKGIGGLAKGTAANMKSGFMKNFDPNVRGGVRNFMVQLNRLRKQKKYE